MKRLLRLAVVVLLLYSGLVALGLFTFAKVPTGFIPSQDMGYYIVVVQLPDASSFERTDAVVRRVDAMARTIPGVAHTFAISGYSSVLQANQPNVGAAFIVVLLAVAAFAPLLATHNPLANDYGAMLGPPGAQHWLGTDTLGRDLLVRLLYGGRVSIAVGLSATFVALTIGVVYGAVAGFFGGKRDAFMMRTVDIMYSLPFPIFVILLMVFFGLSAKTGDDIGADRTFRNYFSNGINYFLVPLAVVSAVHQFQNS